MMSTIVLPHCEGTHRGCHRAGTVDFPFHTAHGRAEFWLPLSFHEPTSLEWLYHRRRVHYYGWAGQKFAGYSKIVCEVAVPDCDFLPRLEACTSGRWARGAVFFDPLPLPIILFFGCAFCCVCDIQKTKTIYFCTDGMARVSTGRLKPGKFPFISRSTDWLCLSGGLFFSESILPLFPVGNSCFAQKAESFPQGRTE